MKTLLIQFYLWPHPMVSSLQPPFLNGNAAVSQFLKAVSASVNHYCIALCKTPDLTQLNAIACYWMNCAVWSSNLCNYFLFFSLAAEHLLRTDPVEDKEGFFIALFVKKGSEKNSEERSGSQKLAGSLSNGEGRLKRSCHVNKKNLALPVFYRGICKPWLHTKSSLTRKTYNSSNWRTIQTWN